MDQINIQNILCVCACGRTTHRDAFSLNSTAHTQKNGIISEKNLRLKECKILHGHASKTSGAQQTMSIKGRIISLKYKEGGEPHILPFIIRLNFVCRNICLCFNSCAAFSSPNYTSRTLGNSFSSLAMTEQNLKR